MNNLILLGLAAISLTLSACGDKNPPPAATAPPASPSTATKPALHSEDIKLKIMGVGLGDASAPCKPKNVVHRELTPPAMLMECSFGKPKDRVTVYFSTDGRRVVRVVRTEYLRRTQIDAIFVLRKAIEFYGRPDQSEEKYMFANYGDAFRITHLSGATQITPNDAGAGLLITHDLCGDGMILTEDCHGLGDYLIRFNLIDVSSYREMERLGATKHERFGEKKTFRQTF